MTQAKFVMVPVEPTEEMIESGMYWGGRFFAVKAYRAMIAAAPQQAQAGEVITPDWPVCNPDCDNFGRHKTCSCEAARESVARQEAAQRAALQPQPQAVDERESFEKWVSASGRAHMLERDARHGWYIDLNVTAWFAGWQARASLSAQPTPVAAEQPVKIDIQRIEGSLASGTIQVPQGMSREEKRAFIINAAHPVTGQSRDDILKEAANVCADRAAKFDKLHENEDVYRQIEAEACANDILALKTANAEQQGLTDERIKEIYQRTFNDKGGPRQAPNPPPLVYEFALAIESALQSAQRGK